MLYTLQDAVFDNMTHKQWTQTIRSKVDSSWNLHQLLPKKLDFFILVSSLSGIYGLASQSNYAAGNTFLDALARMRAATSGVGTSVSLDLGWMQSIGIVAEHADYRRMREQVHDMVPIQTQDLLALLEHYCDPLLPPPNAEQSQLLIGIQTPTDFLGRGEKPPPHISRPLFAGFGVVRPHAAARPKGSAGVVAAEDVAEQFRQAHGAKERSAVVVEATKRKLAHAVGISPDQIDPSRGLVDYGVDSLMAVELRNWVWREFGASVAVFEVMDGRDLEDIGQLVAEKAG
jgi:aryl carrier-like protein